MAFIAWHPYLEMALDLTVSINPFVGAVGSEPPLKIEALVEATKNSGCPNKCIPRDRLFWELFLESFRLSRPIKKEDISKSNSSRALLEPC